MKKTLQQVITTLTISGAFLLSSSLAANTKVDTSVNLKDQSVPVFTLTGVIALAIRNNTSLKQDKLDRINQKFALRLKQWYFQPQYSLGSEYDYNHSVKAGAGSFTRSFSVSPEATLNGHHGTTFTLSSGNTWDYDDGNKPNPFTSAKYNPTLTLEIKQQLSKGVSEAVVDAALNTAEDTEQKNKLAFKDDVTDVIAKVITSYVQLINDQLSLEADQENLDMLEKTVNNTKLQIKAGQDAQNSLVDAQSQVASAQFSIEQENNAIYSDRETLLDSIGLQPDVPFRLPNDLKKELVHDAEILSNNKNIPDLQTSEKESLANNSSYQTAAIELKIAARSLMVTKDDNRWDLSLDASRTQGREGASELFDGKNYSDDVKLNLKIPINDLQNKADLVSAQIALDNAISSLSRARRQLFSNVRDDLNSVVSTEQQLDAAKKAVTLQEQNVAMTNKLVKFGRSSTFELLQKQQDLVTDRNNVITAESAYLNALVSFDTQLNVLIDRWDIKIRY